MEALCAVSGCNLERLRRQVRAEVERTGCLTSEGFAQALRRRREEVGEDPPLGLSTSIAGLATILHHGGLFTLWDVQRGSVHTPPELAERPSHLLSNWRPDQRRLVESAIAGLVDREDRPPVYAALASQRGEDRRTGGMFIADYAPVTLELPRQCARCFHWGDSFDAILDDAGGFEPAWCLSPEDALEAKAMLDVVRGQNFPIVGRTDFGRDHPRIADLIHLGRVTPLFMEALIYDPPALQEAALVVRRPDIAAEDRTLWAQLGPRLGRVFREVVLR